MMSFILRSFALSFSIFWRALPSWFVLAALIYAGFGFSGSHPFLFGFFLLIGSGTIMVFMTFVHIRQGLTALGEVTPPDLGKMALRSFKFFRFIATFNSAITALNILGFWALAKYGLFDFDNAISAIKSGSTASLEDTFSGANSYLINGYFSLTSALTTLAYCAIAVPMAANAAACTPKAPDTEVFWGFGAYTLRLFLLQLLSGTVLTVVFALVAFVAVTMPMFDGQALYELIQDEQFFAPTTTQSWVLMGIVLSLPVFAVVWMVSIWCAGATVCFVDHRATMKASKDFDMACIYEAPMDLSELRALRMSRTPSIA